MADIGSTMLKRTAAVLLCSAALGLSAMAQSDQNPTPPAQNQTQGPPPPPDGGGPGGHRGGPGGGPGGGGPEQRVHMLQTQLGLTDDQSAKIKGILLSGRDQMKALREDTTLSQEDRRSKTMAMMKGQNEQIKALLTPDQKTKYEAMEKQQREQQRERRENGSGTPPTPPSPPPAPEN